MIEQPEVELSPLTCAVATKPLQSTLLSPIYLEINIWVISQISGYTSDFRARYCFNASICFFKILQHSVERVGE